jgi:hypothetical protein
MGDYVLHYMDFFDALALDQFSLGGFSLGGWSPPNTRSGSRTGSPRCVWQRPPDLTFRQSLFPICFRSRLPISQPISRMIRQLHSAISQLRPTAGSMKHWDAKWVRWRWSTQLTDAVIQSLATGSIG